MTSALGEGVALVARFDGLEGHREDVVRLLTAYARHVRGTPGCVMFEPTTATTDPLAFAVYERYRDDASFAAHLAEPENATFNTALSPHVRGTVRLEMLDPLIS